MGKLAKPTTASAATPPQHAGLGRHAIKQPQNHDAPTTDLTGVLAPLSSVGCFVGRADFATKATGRNPLGERLAEANS